MKSILQNALFKLAFRSVLKSVHKLYASTGIKLKFGGSCPLRLSNLSEMATPHRSYIQTDSNNELLHGSLVIYSCQSYYINSDLIEHSVSCLQKFVKTTKTLLIMQIIDNFLDSVDWYINFIKMRLINFGKKCTE